VMAVMTLGVNGGFGAKEGTLLMTTAPC